MPPPYQVVPTSAQWASDTASAQQRDVVLASIDKLVTIYDTVRNKGFEAIFATGLLYFAVCHWLKEVGMNPAMDKGPTVAVKGLHKCLEDTLTGKFGCAPGGLRHELELMFGRELTPEGLKTDVAQRAAHYMTSAETDQYKVMIDNDGKMYQYTWWDPNAVNVKVLAESKNCSSPGVHRDEDPDYADFAFFVMSMSSELFVAKHFLGPDGQEKGIFHSSYLSGGSVMTAGSILVRGGTLLGVRPDSGHYKPTDVNTVSMLYALKAQGVSLDSCEVHAYDGNSSLLASDFLMAKGDWDSLLKQYVDNKEYNEANVANRPPAFKAKHLKIKDKLPAPAKPGAPAHYIIKD